MKYRGNYEITKKLTTKDLEATGSVTVSDVAVGNLTVSTGADMGGQPIKNMGAPVDAGDALTRQYFEDNQVKAIFSNAEPTSSDGVDGALWMKTGGDSFSPPTSLNSDPLLDDFALAVTNTGVVSSVNLGAADDKFSYTTDSGVTWNETSMQANGLMKGYLLAFRNNRFVVFRQEANGSDKRPSNTTDGGVNWGDSTFAVASSGTITITAAESDPKQGTAVVFGSNANPRVMYTQTDGATWQDAFATTGFDHETIIDVTVTNLAAMVLHGGNQIRQTSNFVNWASKTALTVSGATAPDEWVALSHQTSAGRIVAVGKGGNSQYVATSSNTGGSWTYRDLGVGPLEAYDVCFNRGSEVTVISGANGMFYSTDYTQLASTTACTITGGTDYPTKLYADESTGGFYGITESGTVAVSTDGINWTISEAPGITQVYGKNNGSWVPTQFKTEEEILTLINSSSVDLSSVMPIAGGTFTGPVIFDGQTGPLVQVADFKGPTTFNDMITSKGTLMVENSNIVVNNGNIDLNGGNLELDATSTLNAVSGVDIDFGGNIVAGVGTPTTGTDAVNKTYVDGVAFVGSLTTESTSGTGWANNAKRGAIGKVVSGTTQESISLKSTADLGLVELTATGDTGHVNLLATGATGRIKITTLGDAGQMFVDTNGDGANMWLGTYGVGSDINIQTWTQDSDIIIQTYDLNNSVLIETNNDNGPIDIRANNANSPVNISAAGGDVNISSFNTADVVISAQNGNGGYVRFGSGVVKDVADPVDGTDVANKQFVENIAGTQETVTSVAAAGKAFTEFDYTVTPFVFADVVAYATGKQYMATVHVMFDGTDINVQEFGVMSVGGLDVDIEGAYTTGNNAQLIAKTMSGETDITVKISARYR